MKATAATLAVMMRGEWFRLIRRSGFRAFAALTGILVLGILASVVIFQHWLSPVAELGAELGAAGYPRVVAGPLDLAGSIIGIVLAWFLFGTEFNWGTWRALTARGLPRRCAVTSKLAVGALCLVALFGLTWLAAAVVGLLAGAESTASAASGSMAVAASGVEDSWVKATGRLASACLSSIAYLALGALLCVASRSGNLVIGAGIGIVFVEWAGYPIVSLAAEVLWNFDLGAYLRWTLWGVTRGLAGNDDLRPFLFLPAVLAYLGLFVSLTQLAFHRQDLRSGNG